ncbi:exopolysaccharide biosynthesis protein [Alteromonas sp. ASW11-130]|uniref:exopolysaccharide biosynthesis protein n=1 Tax=Alteromonas sp. ASW11-130 TaxID=3015775 RepID=UPI002242552E|nr:exopolysaccharide biosynthesis protein [Alteromonas sp. ASW11-130]MCW8090899.1 exopolysaccharide biosynthesis protein [Alteromonas sp. ASW11-130]
MAASINLTEAMDELVKNSSGEKATVHDMVEALENRGYGPLLLAPSIIVILPTGAIPGVPSICGITIFLITIQLVFGKMHPWLPQQFEKVEFERDTLKSGVEKVKPYTKKIDKLFRPRLEFFIQPIVMRLLALVCGLTALLMIPLEVIPFAAALPALAVGFIGIGLSTKDGMMALIGLLIATGSVYLVLNQIIL